MPAGRVLGVMLIALAIAALFNSKAVVRAGEGMQPGHTRDIVLSVGRPIDDVAGAIGFHLPREGPDLAVWQEAKNGAGEAGAGRSEADPRPHPRDGRAGG